jgi:hypothetical protein
MAEEDPFACWHSINSFVESGLSGCGLGLFLRGAKVLLGGI